jgi:hypothetical protein
MSAESMLRIRIVIPFAPAWAYGGPLKLTGSSAPPPAEV